MPAAGACLVVANHASWKDIPLLAGCFSRPLRFVAMSGVLNVATFGPLIDAYLKGHTSIPAWLRRSLAPRLARFLAPRLNALGAIPLTAGYGLRRRVRDILSRGGVVVIFAQGGLRRGVEPGSFRHGVGWIACTIAALGVDVSVLPVALLGTDRGRFRTKLEARVGRPRRAPAGEGRTCYARLTRQLEADVMRLARITS
jgi:1-acyl-sn-glycerol-3-phosphate acyltransferase